MTPEQAGAYPPAGPFPPVTTPREELALSFLVDGTPHELKRWWTDLPDTYEAEDPREQPHRIELVEETEDGGIYDTTWRGPMGIPITLREILHAEGPGRWRFEIPGPGYLIEDRYEAELDGDHTRLRIRSTITYTGLRGKITRRLLIPGWKERFAETFANAVAVFQDQH